MKKAKWLLGFGSLLVLGCQNLDSKLPDQKISGDCRYQTITGVVTILSIEDPTTEPGSCPSPKKVTFRFDAARAVEVVDAVSPPCLFGEGLSTNCISIPETRGNTIVTMGGMNPPQQWLIEMGITVGSTHQAVQSQRVSGDCTPEIIRFSNLDFGRANEICFN